MKIARPYFSFHAHHVALSIVFILGLLALALSGCASSATFGSAPSSAATDSAPAVESEKKELVRAFVQIAGPIAVRRGQAELVEQILEKNPKRVKQLRTLAAALDVLAAGTEDAEISEARIRAWVAKNSERLELMEGEDEDLVALLMLARTAALQTLGGGTLHLADARVKPWLRALASGIRSGVAQFEKEHPTA